VGTVEREPTAADQSSAQRSAVTELAEMVNIDTLFAFVRIALGVFVLRRTRPQLKRPSGPQRLSCR